MAVLVLTLNLKWNGLNFLGLNFLGLHISPSQRNLRKDPIHGSRLVYRVSQGE